MASAGAARAAFEAGPVRRAPSHAANRLWNFAWQHSFFWRLLVRAWRQHACPQTRSRRNPLQRTARAAASTGPSFDERAFLSQAYPGIASASANVSWKAPTLEPYQHRLVKEDGTVLVRDSIASSQRVVARVIVERAFVTPIAAMFGSFSGMRGYTVEGTGIALRDTTAQSGRW